MLANWSQNINLLAPKLSKRQHSTWPRSEPVLHEFYVYSYVAQLRRAPDPPVNLKRCCVVHCAPQSRDRYAIYSIVNSHLRKVIQCVRHLPLGLPEIDFSLYLGKHFCQCSMCLCHCLTFSNGMARVQIAAASVPMKCKIQWWVLPLQGNNVCHSGTTNAFFLS